MRIAFFSAALLASGLASAAVPIDGWYASVFGGYSYLPDNISNTRFVFFTRAHASYDNGYHAGGRVGYQSNPLRYEAEVTYISADLEGFRLNNIRQTGIDGESTATLAMANVYYDSPEIVPCVTAFLGAGLGYGYLTARLNGQGPIFPTRFKATGSVFAYQGTGGFTYNFSENYAANIAYRYVGTERPNEFGKIFQAHLASVGVIYRFDGNNYK